MMDTRKKIALIFLGIVLNLLGRFIAVNMGLPTYMTLLGSLFVTGFGLPLLGGIVALASGLISSVFIPNDLYFIVCDVVTVVVAGFAAKKHHYLDRVMTAIGSIALFTTLKGGLVWFVDELIYEGRTTFELADAVIDWFDSVGVSGGPVHFLAALFVAFLEVLICQTLLFLDIQSYYFRAKRRRARRLKKALGGKVTLGVVIAALFVHILCPGAASAASGINL